MCYEGGESALMETCWPHYGAVGCACLPWGAVEARWPVPALPGGCSTAMTPCAMLTAAGNRKAWLSIRLGDTSAAPLQKGFWGEDGPGESAQKDLLSVVKKIAVMLSFGALAMSAELYSLLGIKS